MLESLRAIQNTWIGKAVVATVMGLIMVSFVIWGVGPVFTGFNANTMATVGSQTVTVDAFRQAYQSELQQLQQRARRPITNAQAHQFGLDTQVLSRLVSDAVLDDEAHRLGLAIGQDRIVKAITTDPTFAAPGGQFDRARFEQLLRENDMNEAMFVREQRNVYLRQELIQALIGGLAAPQAAVDALHAFQTETRSIDAITLPAAAAGDIPQPDDATLRAFFTDRAASYRAPEYRKLVVLPILPATVARPEDVSDADVQALYDRVKATRFTTAETRTVQQIVYPTDADATAAAESLKTGKTFADLAADRKLTDKDIDLGTITREGAYDRGVGEAAFALPEGGVSAPVKTAFGVALVHVLGITPATVRPLADVAASLRLELATSRTGETIRTLGTKVEDARASGQNLTDAAKAANVAVTTIDGVDASGLGRDGKPVDLPDRAALLKAAFASDVGVDNDTLRTPDGGQVFFEVAAVDPARPKTFDEVKDAVAQAWREDEIARRLKTKADETVKSLQGGTSLEAIAATLNLPVTHVADVRRSGATGLNAGTVAQVFDTKVGGVATSPGDDATRLVFKVLGSVVPALDPDAPDTKQLTTQYQNAMADEFITTYLNMVQNRIGVKINPAAFNAATGGS